MDALPNPLAMRPVSDHDASLWRNLFDCAGQFSTPERRAGMYAALIIACLRLHISVRDLLNRGV